MGFISKIFGNNDEEFNEVRVDREVLESVIYYAKKEVQTLDYIKEVIGI